MTDVPTLTSATAANYCVLNPLQLATPVVAYSVSNGNLQLNSNAGSTYNCFANGTIFVTSGKWYAEFTQISGTRLFVGISSFTDISTPNNWNNVSIAYINTGDIVKENSTITTVATWTNGDVIGVAYDADAATCAFYKNNSLQTTVTGVVARTYSFSVNGYQSGVVAANFGQQPFVYTPPTGFVALNTFNLPTPTIGATASTTANEYFDATLYTGNATTNNIVNAGGMQPDLVWIKSRSNAQNNNLFDSIRGAGYVLFSNATNAETNNTANFTSFNSNGFSLASNGGDTNFSGYTYVAWQWRASNAAGVSNTSGSITSTVSASTTAGFSIVTYTGNGTAGATIGHGLGVAPNMIIVKNRTTATTDVWVVRHSSLVGNDKYILLDRTDPEGSLTSAWNNTAPTSSVFSVGTLTDVNRSTNTFVAYCFAQVAGYSAFGSYTGNGSTDGPFIYTGFRPRFIMIKASSAARGWIMFDTARDPYNVAQYRLFANTSDAEFSGTTANNIDIVSNGFKPRLGSNSEPSNESGTTYIYMAFAEYPFKYANAR
jgi:hypothetical protein